MALIAVRTLGAVAIQVATRRLGPSAGRPFAVLLYLTSRRGQPTPRRVLQELLPPATDEPKAGHNLRQLFYRLRQLGVPLKSDANGVEIEAEHVWVDWRAILERGELGTPDLELIAQGLLPGYDPEISEGYREWFEAERSTVRLRLSRAVGVQLAQLRCAGRWDLVDVAGRALLALDPLSEEGTLARAQAMAAAGSKSAALRLIDDYLREIGDEQPNLRLTPTALRRRISERLPEMGRRAQDDRIFVGREDAMRTLSASGSAARDGTQQTVLVWGEPGMGKTRLLAEYRALACLQGALAFQTTCQPHDVFRPLGILSDLVAQLLEAPGALGCDPDGRKLLDRIVRSSSSPCSTDDENAPASLYLITQAVEDLLNAISQEAVFILFVDDAQWLDAASLRALLVAFSAKIESRASLVFASRERWLLTNSDFLADNVTSIRLNALENEPALHLARHLLRGSETASGMEQHILALARGNPFLIRLLCLHLNTTSDSHSLPLTVREILERRLEQLSVEGTRTLEACVVLGKNCTFARLEKILNTTRLQLLRAVEELSDRGLTEIQDGCFVSSHTLLSDAVHKRMSDAVGRALHAAAAEILQLEFGSAPIGSLPWDCAEHWRLAGQHSQAVAVLKSCAQRAIDIGRPTDAVATLRLALVMPSSDVIRMELIDTALSTLWLGAACHEATDLLRQRKQLRQQSGLTPVLHDEYELLEFAASFNADHGDPRAFIHRLRCCLTAEDASPKHRLACARILMMIAEMTLDRDLAEFAYYHSRSLEPGTDSRVLCDLLYHTCFGAPDVVPELADELIRTTAEDHPRSLTYLLNAAHALYRVGDSHLAEQKLLEGYRAAERYRAWTHATYASLMLARYYWSAKLFDECERWHACHSELQALSDDPNLVMEHRVLGARLALRRGDVDLAKSWIDRATLCMHATLELPTLFLKACLIDFYLATHQSAEVECAVESALPLHFRARNLGCQDDVTIALFKGLRSLGRHAEASNLVREYLNSHRRDSFAPPAELISVFSLSSYGVGESVG